MDIIQLILDSGFDKPIRFGVVQNIEAWIEHNDFESVTVHHVQRGDLQFKLGKFCGSFMFHTKGAQLWYVVGAFNTEYVAMDKKEAILEGCIYYFADTPCPNGHKGHRRILKRGTKCVECEQLKHGKFKG